VWISSQISINSTKDAGRIAGRYAIRWNISRHHASCAYCAVASNGNAGKNYSVCADPRMIFDDNRRGRWRHLSLFYTVLVPIHKVATNADFLVGRDRHPVVDERMIANRNMRTLV
jgi:hypothetical protein